MYWRQLFSWIFALLFLGFASPFSEADSNNRRTAVYIASQIDFLSASDAQAYVRQYNDHFKRCLQKSLPSLQCQKKSIQAVHTTAEHSFSERIFRKRIDHLRKQRHFSNYVLYPDRNQPTVGIIGDSLVSGALASEHIYPSVWNLTKQLIFNMYIAQQDTYRPIPLLDEFRQPVPTSRVFRIFDTPQSFRTQPFRRWGENKSWQYIDCEECSFAYSLARLWKVPSSNIFFGAQIGTRIDSVSKQLERVALPMQHLPEVVIVSYTGNDICGTRNRAISAEQTYNYYYRTMLQQFEYSLKKLKPAPNGTGILVVAAADFSQLVESQSILDKKVLYSFNPFSEFPHFPPERAIRCEELRRGQVEGARYFNNMCPFVLNTSPDDHFRIAHIKKLHMAVVRAQRDAVIALSQNPALSEFQFRFTDAILDVEFTGKDISPDCFHPSIHGHEKIANALRKAL